MKKNHFIIVLGMLINLIGIAQVETTKVLDSIKVNEKIQKVEDSITNHSNTNVVNENISKLNDSITISSLKNKEDITKEVTRIFEEYFAYGGKNGNQVFFKRLSDDEIFIFEDFANDDLKNQMLSLTKDDISKVYGITYQALDKKVDSKKLDGDGEQIQTTISKVFEMLSVKPQ